MEIKKLLKEDVSNAMELVSEAAAALSESGIDQWDEQYPSNTDIESDIVNGEAFGLFESGRLTSYMVLNQYNDPQYIDIKFKSDDTGALTMHRLAVAPDRQRQGLADRMINFAEDYARSNGYVSIRLDAFSLNPAALGLYEKHNYQQVGTVLFRKGSFHIFEKILSEIEYRDMCEEESSVVLKLARSVFPFFYRLFMRHFKNAVIAVENGRIIGGAVWHRFRAGKNIFGYLDFGFTEKGQQGRGIGRETYTRAINKMKAEKCKTLGALVLCDNTSSWKLLADRGFVRADRKTLVERHGWTGAIKIFFETAFAFSPGADIWITEAEEKKRSSVSEMMLLVLLSAFIALAQGLYLYRQSAFYTAAAVLTVYAFRILLSYLFSIKIRKNLTFRFWRSGLLITAIVFFAGGVYPPGGDFYPSDVRWSYSKHRKQLGLIGLGGWLAVIILAAVFLTTEKLFPGFSLMVSGVEKWLYMLLIINCVPFIMESWSGARVWKWNKIVFTAMASVSIVLLIFIFTN